MDEAGKSGLKGLGWAVGSSMTCGGVPASSWAHGIRAVSSWVSGLVWNILGFLFVGWGYQRIFIGR